MSGLTRPMACGTAAVVFALGLAVPAHGAGMKGSCVVKGAMKFADKKTPSIGMRILGGKGTFTFSTGSMNCTGTAKGVPFSTVISIAGTTGTYSSSVCGTGKMVGVITAGAAPAKFVNALNGRKFALEYAAFKGAWYWHSWEKPMLPLKPFAPDSKKPSDPKSWMPAGTFKFNAPTAEDKPPRLPGDGECTKALGFVAPKIQIDF